MSIIYKQINYRELLRQEGVILSKTDKNDAEFLLTHIGFFRLKNYLHYVKNTQKDCCFDMVFDLYVFDRKLRNLILEAIEKIEVSIKTIFADKISAKYQDYHVYCKTQIYRKNYDKMMQNLLSNFMVLNQEDRFKITGKLISSNKYHIDFSCEIQSKNYNYILPPVWEFVNWITFGQLVSLITNINIHDQKIIAKSYNIPAYHLLVDWLYEIAELRNHSAHHARVWNRVFKNAIKLPQKLHNEFPKDVEDILEKEKQLKGDDLSLPRKQLYIRLVIIQYLLKQLCPPNIPSTWGQRLYDLIKYCKIDSKHMGFSSDWYEDAFWGIIS